MTINVKPCARRILCQLLFGTRYYVGPLYHGFRIRLDQHYYISLHNIRNALRNSNSNSFKSHFYFRARFVICDVIRDYRKYINKFLVLHYTTLIHSTLFA